MSELDVQIDGLRELQAALRRLENGAQTDLRKAWNQAAEIVVADVRARVPRRSGRAASSVRAASTQRHGMIRAGGARVPYYPWLDFGGRVGRNKRILRPFVREGRYIFPAIRRHRPEIVRTAERELRRLIDKHGLG